MNKKYEFVPGDEKVIAPGRTVKRIRSLVAIAIFDVPSGSLGGYIESEANLSVYGNAWVSGNVISFGIWRSNLTKQGEILASMNLIPNPQGYYILYKKVWATPDPQVFESDYDRSFQYHLGGVVGVDDADPTKTQCSSGIHVTNSLFFKFAGDTWLALRVHIDDILFWGAPDKIRCRRVEVLYIVDTTALTTPSRTKKESV